MLVRVGVVFVSKDQEVSLNCWEMCSTLEVILFKSFLVIHLSRSKSTAIDL